MKLGIRGREPLSDEHSQAARIDLLSAAAPGSSHSQLSSAADTWADNGRCSQEDKWCRGPESNYYGRPEQSHRSDFGYQPRSGDWRHDRSDVLAAWPSHWRIFLRTTAVAGLWHPRPGR